jgi:hypothetical protein
MFFHFVERGARGRGKGVGVRGVRRATQTRDVETREK